MQIVDQMQNTIGDGCATRCGGDAGFAQSLHQGFTNAYIEAAQTLDSRGHSAASVGRGGRGQG